MPTTHYTDDRGEFETDDRWTATDNFTFSNLHPPSRPNHASLSHAVEHASANGLPDIACPAVQGKFFALQCRMLNVTNSLEVGTLGGYSALWLLTENPQLRVTTIEFDPHHAKIAQQNFEFAGVADRVEIIVGAGMDILPKIHEDIKTGKRERFGFAFIDADKANNWNYFDFAVKMSKPRACVVVDNVAARGHLADEDAGEHSTRVASAREVIERVGKDGRVDATVLQTVSDKDYDGFLIASVKK